MKKSARENPEGREKGVEGEKGRREMEGEESWSIAQREK